MTKLLLTGASGQVGSRLSNALAISGYDVFGVGTRQLRSEVSGSQKYHQFDLLEDEIEALIQEIRPDVLIHLAWETQPNTFWESPQNTVWLEKSIELANTFSKWGGKKIVVAGTSAEYDWESQAPFAETGPEVPKSIYGQTKLDLLNFLRGQSTPFLWTRTFFQFGAKEPPGRLIPSLIDSLWAGLEFTIQKPDDVRDFIYINDVVEIMTSLVITGEEGVFNVASGVGITTRDIGEKIASIFGRPDLLKFHDQTEKPSIVLADTTKLEEALGGVDYTSLEDAISETMRERATP